MMKNYALVAFLFFFCGLVSLVGCGDDAPDASTIFVKEIISKKDLRPLAFESLRSPYNLQPGRMREAIKTSQSRVMAWNREISKGNQQALRWDSLSLTFPQTAQHRRGLETLNEWLFDQSPPANWQPTSLLDTLPEPLQELPQIKTLDQKQFAPFDAHRILETIWSAEIGNWVLAPDSSKHTNYSAYQYLLANRKHLGEQDAKILKTMEELPRSVREAMLLFDWTRRNIQLDNFSKNLYERRFPLFAWEALLFGHGDYDAWTSVFIALLKQRNIGAVLLAPSGDSPSTTPTSYLIGILHEEKKQDQSETYIYLFDPFLGSPLPAKGGVLRTSTKGILIKPATLREALSDPELKLPYPPRTAWTQKQLAKMTAFLPCNPFEISLRAKQLEGENLGRIPPLAGGKPTTQNSAAVRFASNSEQFAKEVLKHKQIERAVLWSRPFTTLLLRQTPGVAYAMTAKARSTAATTVSVNSEPVLQWLEKPYRLALFSVPERKTGKLVRPRLATYCAIAGNALLTRLKELQILYQEAPQERDTDAQQVADKIAEEERQRLEETSLGLTQVIADGSISDKPKELVRETPLYSGRLLYLAGEFAQREGAKKGAIAFLQKARPSNRELEFDSLAKEMIEDDGTSLSQWPTDRLVNLFLKKVFATQMENSTLQLMFMQFPQLKKNPDDVNMISVGLLTGLRTLRRKVSLYAAARGNQNLVEVANVLIGRETATFWLGLINAADNSGSEAIDLWTNRMPPYNPWTPLINYNSGRINEYRNDYTAAQNRFLAAPFQGGIRAQWLQE